MYPDLHTITPMRKIPKISIITVGMNHLTFLQELLPSIYTNIHSDKFQEFIEMIYVDNCSKDGTIEYIQKYFPQVKILQNKKTLGFGENNNRGVLAAHGEYIAIINPDIILYSGSLEKLYNYAITNPQIGIIVPQLLNPNGSIQYSVRRFISFGKLLARTITKGRDSTNNSTVSSYLCKNMDYNITQEVDWAIGAAMFMKRELYAELGGFDTDYFLYMEDEDVCLRSWKINRPVIYYPEVKMIHNHLRASSHIGKKMFIHIRSMMTFFRKHGLSPKR